MELLLLDKNNPLMILIIFILVSSVFSQRLIGEVVNTNHNIPINITNSYQGLWQKVQGNNQFENSNGRVAYSKLKAKFLKIGNGITKFKNLHFMQGDILFRDGQYLQDKLFIFRINGVYNVLNGNFEFYLYPRSLEGTNKYRDLIMRNPFNDTLLFKALLLGIQQNPIPQFKSLSTTYQCTYKGLLKANINQEVQLEGLIQALDCDSILLIHLDLFKITEFFNSANNYSLMISLLALINIFLTVHQMSYSRSSSATSKVSLLMISLQAMMDAYLCLIHLGGGLVYEELFKSLTVSSFLLFILFSMFEMRFLFSIWKSRRPPGFNEWENVRQEFQTFYTRFYGSMFILFIIIYQVNSALKYFLILLYSYWLPQIYCNFTRDCKHSLSPYYIIIVGYTRMILPLYFLSCPKNIFFFENNLTLSFILFFWTNFQIIILLLQHYFGPRFMIPSFFLPSKYNYKKETPMDVLKEQTCVICMNNFEDQDYLVTPCNHYFHTECLQQWMNEKHECPTCRNQIPEI